LALEQAGIPVIGQEGGEYIHAVTTLQKGLAEKLDQYPDHSFGGAFLKDTWLLLSPSQRREMLTGLKRILQPQGSLLLISEIISEYHARGSKTGEIVAHDYPSWRAGVSLIQSNEGLETINYLSTPEDTRCTAEENGYEFTLIREYPKTDPLARENRWTPGDGFIAKLTPKTGEE
jgi:hypothetical protein